MAAPVDNEFLVQAAIYLGATAVAVPLFKRLKLGTILGFLAAGILLGPSALGWIKAEEGVFHVAELGVVLFLFVIGLELSFPRLLSLRKTIFGLGLSQMIVTGLLIAGLFRVFGILPIGPALVVGFALACSSTAFALSFLSERRELNSGYGTKAFSVLLFQDLAVIPLLAAVPFVAIQTSGSGEALAVDWWAAGKAIGVVLGIIFLGKYVLNVFLRAVAISGSREAFTAAALFVVAATALGVAQVGLSMALGAFLAGVLLAESAFRHQIESDIQPFRELLLGLFFIGVGMQLDLSVVLASWDVVLLGALALIIGKMVILYALTRVFRADGPTAFRVGGVLSQGGEFAFVVFSLGTGAGLFSTQLSTLLSAVVTLSMMFTPVLMMAINRWANDKVTGDHAGIVNAPQGTVLLVGFGRMGQLVGQMLSSSGVSVTAIDNDPRRIEVAAQFGSTVYFGDGTNIPLLVQAGAMNVDAVVFTLRARDQLKPTVAALRERCPNVRILARLHDRLHEIEMMDVETNGVVRELLESAVALSGKTLSHLGFSDELIAEISAEFRERDRDRLLAQRAEGIYAKKDVLSQPFRVVENENANKS